MGQRCPAIVRAITSPLWLIMVLIVGVDLAQPTFLTRLFQVREFSTMKLLYGIGVWYVWLVFTLAFGLGTVGKHILFYNLPAFLLFSAGAVLQGIVGWRRLKSGVFKKRVQEKFPGL